MIRILIAYFILFVIFYVGIPAFLQMTGRQKWDVTKLALYSLFCSIAAIFVMIMIVVLF